MHPILHLGTLSIPAFGVCILCGTVLCFILLRFIRRFSDLSENDTLDAVIWAIILGFLGAKILYFITDPPAMPTSFRAFISLLTSGLVFYGGLIGGVGAIVLVALHAKKNVFAFTDLLAPCFCLAHAGGRVGCIMAGCCYGSACEPSIFALTYPDGAAFPDGIATRIAIPLFEAIFLVLLCGVLVWILAKQKRRGSVTGWYLIVYAVWRFFIEFFRGDDIRGFVGGLSTSQFISIPILLAGVIILIINRNNLLLRVDPAVENAPVPPVRPQPPEMTAGFSDAVEPEPFAETEPAEQAERHASFETAPAEEAAPSASADADASDAADADLPADAKDSDD